MAIGSASEKGSFVYLYDEKGCQIGCIGLSGGRTIGFTSTSISIERGNFVYTYDEKGRQIGCRGK